MTTSAQTGDPIANQALASEYLLTNRTGLGRRVHRVPDEVDREIAEVKLAAMGAGMDALPARGLQ